MCASRQSPGKCLTFAEVLTLFSVSPQCHFFFLGKNSGVKKEACKGSRTVSEILETGQLLTPDVKRRSLVLSLNCSVNDFT